MAQYFGNGTLTYVYIMYTFVTYRIHVFIFLQNPLESLGSLSICCFIFALDEVQLSLQFGFISASKLCLKINNVQTSEMVICDERIYLFTRTTPSKWNRKYVISLKFHFSTLKPRYVQTDSHFLCSLLHIKLKEKFLTQIRSFCFCL